MTVILVTIQPVHNICQWQGGSWEDWETSRWAHTVNTIGPSFGLSRRRSALTYPVCLHIETHTLLSLGKHVYSRGINKLHIPKVVQS